MHHSIAARSRFSNHLPEPSGRYRQRAAFDRAARWVAMTALPAGATLTGCTHAREPLPRRRLSG
jgi:hypothetical protein